MSHFSRVTLTPPNPQAILALVAGRFKADDPSLAHKLLWTLFGDDADQRRDFIYEVQSHRPFQALVRSARPPRDGLGCWSIETMPWIPRLSAGQSLHFSLNAVAARAVKRAGARGRPVDVVMAEWQRLPPERQQALRPDDLADPVGREWLASQGERNGFSFSDDAVQVISYERHRFPNKGRAPITFGSLRFAGTLTVTDAERFASALFTGLGRARGFGFGMLLIAS